MSTKISSLQATIEFRCLEDGKMVSIFEDEGISQQRRSIWITSFIIFLFSSTSLGW